MLLLVSQSGKQRLKSSPWTDCKALVVDRAKTELPQMQAMSHDCQSDNLGNKKPLYDKAPGKDHDLLFESIRALAAKAMQPGKTEKAVCLLVSEAFRFTEAVIADYEAGEPLAEPLACKMGCHYCCCYEVVLTPAEALLLGHHVKETYSDGALAALMKKIDRNLRLRDGRGVEERARVLHDTPCIFLAGGKCAVYHARPFVCRALRSLDGGQCKEAVMARRRLVEFTGYTHRYYVFQTAQAALTQFFADMGCQTQELTMAWAMKQYFQRPGITGAWLRGDEGFIAKGNSPKQQKP